MSLSRQELLELIKEMFGQACWTEKGYNHQYLSTYEEAQRVLISEGLIDKSSCVYGE